MTNFNEKDILKNTPLIEDIDYEIARDYLVNMKNPNLRNLFSVYTGGTFFADDIKNWMQNGNANEVFTGLMFWNCIDDDGNFVIVMEPKFGFDYKAELENNGEICSWRPTNLGMLTMPGQEFSDNIYHLGYYDVLTRLRKFEFDVNEFNYSSSPNFNVNVAIERFLSEETLSLINKSPFSYFATEDIARDVYHRRTKYLEQFFGQVRGRIEYVRYFFGYDNSPGMVYPLRMILVPVDNKGRNIVIYQRMKFREQGDKTILLQKSWPPPPYA